MDAAETEELLGEFDLLLMGSTPTIAEARQMLRDGQWWPCPFFSACMDAGLDIKEREEATIHWTPSITDDLVDVHYQVRQDGVLIAKIGIQYQRDGRPDFVALTRMKTPDWCR